ncbi:MAG: pilin [Patescibacteria group bacterium]
MTLTWKRSIMFGLALTMLLSGFTSLARAEEPAATPSAAASIMSGLEDSAGAYNSNLTLTSLIGNLIQALLTATGIIFLVLMVWAGVLYMTAAGEDDKVKKAKKMIVSALVGLIIIVGAYALTSYVVTALSEASGETTTETK